MKPLKHPFMFVASVLNLVRFVDTVDTKENTYIEGCSGFSLTVYMFLMSTIVKIRID